MKSDKIELEPLKLRQHEVKVDSAGRWIITIGRGEPFVLPSSYQNLYRMSVDGMTPAQMAARLARDSGTGRLSRFHQLSSYLGFLCDQRLIVDRRVIRMVESLRSDYRWRESIAFDTLFQLELFKLESGQSARVGTAYAVAFLFASTGVYFLAQLVRAGGLVDGQNWVQSSTAWPVLVAFLFSFGVGRSLSAIAQLIGMKIGAGFGAFLGVRMDAVSVSLATDDVSVARGPLSYLLIVASTGLWLASPIAIAKGLGLSEEIMSFIPVFTVLLMLSDFSPLRRSFLTDVLRAYYNHIERENELVEEFGPGPESFIWRVHVLTCAVWVSLAALFCAVPLVQLSKYLRASIDFGTRTGWVSVAAIGLVLLIILFSFIDDIMSLSTLTDSNDPMGVRKIWRRRRPVGIDEAAKQGRAPLREDLEKLPFLRQIEPTTRMRLLEKAEIRSYFEGEKVCRQGDSDRVLFVVLKGRVAIAKTPQGSRRRRVVATLGPGAVFGETAFFFGTARTADAEAVEESLVLAIPHDEEMKTIAQDKSGELQMRVWFLQALAGSSVFKEIPSEAFDALLMAGVRRNYRPSEKVISEGETGASGCFFIVQGQVAVVQNSQLLRKLQAGDVFGEIAVLNPESLRTATIVAESDLLVVQIDAGKFWELLCSHLPLAVEIERIAQNRIRSDHGRAQKTAN